MAREGGLGIVHKNLSVERQAAFVREVKKAVTGVVDDPVVITPDLPIGKAQRLMNEHRHLRVCRWWWTVVRSASSPTGICASNAGSTDPCAR
jgi:hypothetical protein